MDAHAEELMHAYTAQLARARRLENAVREMAFTIRHPYTRPDAASWVDGKMRELGLE